MAHRYAIVTYTAGITSGSDSGTLSALSTQLTSATITYGPAYPAGSKHHGLNKAGIDFNFHTKFNGYESYTLQFNYMVAADWYRIFGYSAGLDVDVYIRVPKWAGVSNGVKYGEYFAVMESPNVGDFFIDGGRENVTIQLNKMIYIQDAP